jgi:beta-mannosidase
MWRPARRVRWRQFVVEDVDLRVQRDEVSVVLRGSSLGGEAVAVTGAALVVGDARAALALANDGSGRMQGSVRLPAARRWWPHTHGESPRYPARIELVIGGTVQAIELGSVAFRTVELDTAPSRDGFALRVNGAPIFCRGASWTTLDVATLGGTPADYARVLGAVKRAGMNMVRLSGTMFYEADAFYDACDELGILVWQDFMFANMDYPIDDEAFRASVAREAAEVTSRLQAHPCLAVLCGGSEVEQQAAMFGADPAVWKSRLFDETLREAASRCPGVPYWPNTPSGGALPFHVDRGVAHYYGVGAYLRSLEDARRANVRFAAECLAFANVPEEDLFASILRPGEAPLVSARWKERTSKDHGATWDFEDVRDHYLRLLFGVDPVRLRSEDPDRYLALSRVTTGEVMARTFAEFRRAGSTCAGALVWFLQDLWPGAGWGILDSRGQPKSPYWFLRRVLEPIVAFITDEGQSGLGLHTVNDGPVDVAARLSFALYRGQTVTCSGETSLVVPARGAIAIPADGVLGRFTDSSRAYRFGPPGHDVALLELRDAGGNLLAEAFHLPDFGAPPPCLGFEATLAKADDEAWTLTVETRTFAQAVAIHVPGYVADDNYFDLAPGRRREIRLHAGERSARAPRGEVKALNGASVVLG